MLGLNQIVHLLRSMAVFRMPVAFSISSSEMVMPGESQLPNPDLPMTQSAPLAIGRKPSAIHSLHEPG